MDFEKIMASELNQSKTNTACHLYMDSKQTKYKWKQSQTPGEPTRATHDDASATPAATRGAQGQPPGCDDVPPSPENTQ